MDTIGIYKFFYQFYLPNFSVEFQLIGCRLFFVGLLTKYVVFYSL